MHAKIILALLLLFGCTVALALRSVILHLAVPLSHDYYGYFDGRDEAFIALYIEKSDIARIQKIQDNSSMLRIGPAIDGYKVYHRVIVGHVRANPHEHRYAGLPYKKNDPQKPGYFIIEPSKDMIYNGLSKQEWLGKLRSFGIHSYPKLYEPSAFDAYNGRNRPR